MKKKLKTSFWLHFTVSGGIILCCMFGFCMCIMEAIKSFPSWGKLVGLCISAMLFLVAVIFGTIAEIIPLCKDMKELRTENFLEVVGKVVAYKRNRAPDTGEQTNTFPIIQTEDGERIVLRVAEKLIFQKTYRFLYLKHSKLAEVAEEVATEQSEANGEDSA